MSSHLWSDLRAGDFAEPGPTDAVAVLPIGAIEQHGPHMPLGTDMILAEAFARKAAEKSKARAMVLPVQAFGASEEHYDWPGTLWLPPELVLDTVLAIGRGVAAAGIKRLVILNGHGGNVPALQMAARRLRVDQSIFVASLGWMAFGLPPVPEEVRRDDIHAGFMETAAMLHLRPDLVDMSKAENFVPTSRAVADSNQYLRVTGPITTGWTAGICTVQAQSAMPRPPPAEAGAAIFDHCSNCLAGFLDEVAAHSPAFLTKTGDIP